MNKTLSKLVLVSWLLSCWAISAPAESSDRLEAIDFFKLQKVSDPQISPNGHQVAYIRTFADVNTDKYYSNLWLVDAEGKSDQALTKGLFHDSEPRWSPDGKRLVFISDREGEPQIFEYLFTEQSLKKIADLKQAPSGIAWSPNGDRIAFSSFVTEDAPSYAKLTVPPEGAKWAEPARVVTQLAYKWDGTGFMGDGFTQLFVLDIDSGQTRQISHDRYHNGGHPAGFVPSAPIWSSDGRSILIAANRHENYEFEPGNTEIYRFDADGKTVAQLSDRHGPDHSPALSPDGQWIAYLGYQELGLGETVTKLTVMRTDGTGARVLLDNLDRMITQVIWSSDGTQLYFSYISEGMSWLALVGIADGAIENLASKLAGNLAAHGGSSFSLTDDGHFATAISSPNHIADIVVGSAGKKLKVLTDVNGVALANKPLGELEELWYQSTLDGKKIHGWLLKPPGFKAERKYPLILSIHGGPQAYYGPNFDFEKQYLAARDYLVLFVNPRGSTSYGQDLINSIHHSFAGEEYQDFLSGIDAVIERGSVDEKNIFVVGGSGGGLYTAWLVGKTDRFAAAVSIYPVINLYSWALTADMAAYGKNHWVPGPPWNNERHYLHRSPISIVDKVTTPTMIMCGEEDHRTPISQSEEFFTALRFRGVETVLVRMPEENHGFTKRPSHFLSRLEYTLGWFEAHRR